MFFFNLQVNVFNIEKTKRWGTWKHKKYDDDYEQSETRDHMFLIVPKSQ